jgi:hypothetical protein
MLKFFATRRWETGLLQSWCKDCRRAYDRERYAQGERDRGREKSRRLRARNRAFVREYLSDKACADCGEGDVLVLEFDHVRGETEFNLGSAVQRAYGLERIKKEISKCDVVCANCHRRRTYRRLGSYRC